MTEIHQQADEFEEQVSAVLQLRGYSIDRNCTVDGTQIDLIAKSQDPLNDLEYLVECCSSGKPVGISGWAARFSREIFSAVQNEKAVSHLWSISKSPIIPLNGGSYGYSERTHS